MLTPSDQLCTWLTIVFQLLAVRAGNGRHLYTLTAEQRRDVAHWTIIGFVPGIISFATPKLATIDLLCRILLPSRGHRIFLWVLGWTCWVQLMITIVFLFVKCDGTYPSVSALGLGSRSTGHKDCLDPWININYDIYTGGELAARRSGTSSYADSLYRCSLFGIRRSISRRIPLGRALQVALESWKESWTECCTRLWICVRSAGSMLRVQ